MVTLKADNRRRVQLPDAKPGDVFEYKNSGQGSVTLTVVKAVVQEPFPPDYDFGLTPARNKELLELAKGSSLEVPK